MKKSWFLLLLTPCMGFGQMQEPEGYEESESEWKEVASLPQEKKRSVTIGSASRCPNRKSKEGENRPRITHRSPSDASSKRKSVECEEKNRSPYEEDQLQSDDMMGSCEEMQQKDVSERDHPIEAGSDRTLSKLEKTTHPFSRSTPSSLSGKARNFQQIATHKKSIDRKKTLVKVNPRFKESMSSRVNSKEKK